MARAPRPAPRPRRGASLCITPHVVWLLAVLALLAGAPRRVGAQYCQSMLRQMCAPTDPAKPDSFCPDGCLRVPGRVTLSCQPGLNKCHNAPRQLEEPCVPGGGDDDCGPGLKCSGFLRKCYPDPPLVNQPCDAKTPCAPGAATCDLTTKRCAAPSPHKGPCHEWGRGCAAGLSCDAARRQCFKSPRAAGEPCTAASGAAECAPGLRCLEATTGECAAIPGLGQACDADNPCGGGLECHPWLMKCYHVPRWDGEPCNAAHPCNGSLICDVRTSSCTSISGVNGPCTDTRPCTGGLECHPGIQRCYNTPRIAGEPCVGPAGLVPCAEGLNCDAAHSMRCAAPGELGQPCAVTVPCRQPYSCSPSNSRCYDTPRSPDQPCGGAGEAPCGNGLLCHPTRRRCVGFSGKGQPCFTTMDGGELRCTGGLYCFPGTHQCLNNPSRKGDLCSPLFKWGCMTGVCNASNPYCP